MSKEIQKIYTSRGLTPPGKHKRQGKHHSAAFHKVVAGIKAAGKANDVNPYAVATESVRKQRKALYK